MTTQNENPRRRAMQSLLACRREGKFANLEIDAALRGFAKDSPRAKADAALYTRLVYGVIERQITLDYILSTLSSRPTDAMDDDVRFALQIGLYQLMYMDRVPTFAAVSESVALLPKGKRAFANAVLRNFLRRGGRDSVTYPTEADAPLSRCLSVRYSVPEELCRLFLDDYGREETEGILSSVNGEPPISLRVNTLRETPAECALRVGGRLSIMAPDIVLVEEFSDAVRNGIEAGEFFIEDEASRVCTAVLGACPGELVVDTCACPGGKTFSMALDMENRGQIHAFDLHKNKLSLIEKGAERLGLTCIAVRANDARHPVPELVGKADRVLCDAPCSGLGVIAKKPDIRYKPLDAIAHLPEVQYAVLEGAAEYVRQGGVLVYSTCTLHKAENEAVVGRFLKNHRDFAPLSCPSCQVDEGGMRTFFPHKDGCDGFFIAKLGRR